MKYTIPMWKDDKKNYDYISMPLVPRFEVPIKSFSADIEFQKATTLSNIKIYPELEREITNRTIKLKGENLSNYASIYGELKEGYWEFPDYGKDSNNFSILLLISPIITFLVWLLFGKEKRMVKTLEFYPPDDLTPGEIGVILDGKAEKKEMIGNIVYMASKGYIKINEKNQKFKFEPINTPPDRPDFIKTLYDGIDGTDRVFSLKYDKSKEQLQNRCSALMDTSTELLTLPIGYMLTVAPSILYMIWDFLNSGKAPIILMSLAGIGGGTYILGKTVEKWETSKSLLMALLSFALIALGLGLLIFPSISYKMLDNDKKIIIYSALCISTLISSICTASMKRKPNPELMGKILGFKDFIETAELDKLNELIEEDPEYFYHIVPYAYVMGLTDKWIEKFENIKLVRPDWAFEIKDYETIFKRCDTQIEKRLIYTNIEPLDRTYSRGKVSSSINHHKEHSSRSFNNDSWTSGGGFSGGGFSGGSFGGGGW